MSDEKVYTPTVIEDLPILQTEAIDESVSKGSGSGTYSPQKTKDTPLPIKKVAHELLSTVLNTASRTIGATVSFLKQGAIQIGEYVQNVSGEIKISPDGIVARNKNGDTTFTIDGETGDATFAGVVTASGVNVIDDKGLVSLSAFDSGIKDILPTQNITSGTYVDITNGFVEFDLERSTKVLLFVTVTAKGVSMSNDVEILGLFHINIDGSGSNNLTLSFNDARLYTSNFERTYSRTWTLSGQQLVTLNAGHHTIKLQAKELFTGTPGGSEAVFVEAMTLTYILLGR